MSKISEQEFQELKNRVAILEKLVQAQPEILKRRYDDNTIAKIKDDVCLIFEKYNLSVEERKSLLYSVLQDENEIIKRPF
ncbi:hypothetical protein [Clostridium botulinum]|uniref:hypothetical protein n=1 Tax=Clostridium botulinum TaxID=1491 RepID=UPI0013F041AD|nr:hypothetical protein [Clostridium botulinum]EGT5649360.1 hypothetical protein [Clostridium botulinum]MBY6755478.1 hypothetical protein [Clostridium botulinum]MBY6766405.1 hypothetical protein [Clostridium botulinum]MBY6900439.1 hypothetical protein [Clostridium botulinum]MBY6914746.1 hypothetical protein [Clostridium botulinum]